jgi:undecaprenyl diphosphate synthase
LAVAAREGRINPAEINENRFAQHLWTSDVPDPDLLIRTGKEFRLSNFLLWQLAYTEIYVTDILWPEFGRDEFLRALADYQSRERRFGRTAEQQPPAELRRAVR